jgi:hypothetical protein
VYAVVKVAPTVAPILSNGAGTSNT